MEKDEEYNDGEYEYGVAEALIEEIVDRFNLKAYLYLSNQAFDNVLSTTMISEKSDEENFEDIMYEALFHLIINILDGKDTNERNYTITHIYDFVHDAIHIDDDLSEDCDDEEDIIN